MKKITITLAEGLDSVRVETEGIRYLDEVLALLQMATQAVLQKAAKNAVVSLQPVKPNLAKMRDKIIHVK